MKRFMRSDHLSKHLKTHQAKKTQQQLSGVMMPKEEIIVPQEDMIDELAMKIDETVKSPKLECPF